MCWKCDSWPDLAFRFEGRDWCGPCAPWARQPWPYAHLDELGQRVLERLDCDELRQARSDAEKVVAWLERAKATWPGPDPWRTVRLASKAEARLLVLEVSRPRPPLRPMWSGEPKWSGPAKDEKVSSREAPPLHGDAPRELKGTKNSEHNLLRPPNRRSSVLKSARILRSSSLASGGSRRLCSAF